MPKLESGRMVVIQTIATIDEMLAQAREFIPGGWVMAESPAEVIFGPISDHSDKEKLAACESITLFGPEAELRMEKRSGELSGVCRTLRQARSGEEGAEYAVRQLAYILRRDQRPSLLYSEYFSEDESGFLKLRFGRLSGIDKGGSQ